MQDDQRPQEPDMRWSNKKFLPMRATVTLMSVWFMGMGLWTVFSGEFHGTTRSGAEVDLTGSKAFWTGLSFTALGAFPLGMWATNKKALLWGLMTPLVLFAIFLVIGLTR